MDKRSNIIMKVDTDISDAKQGNKEGSKSCGEGEEFSVSFKNLKIICQPCDDCLHTTHLKKTNQHEKQQLEVSQSFKCSILIYYTHTHSHTYIFFYVDKGTEILPV